MISRGSSEIRWLDALGIVAALLTAGHPAAAQSEDPSAQAPTTPSAQAPTTPSAAPSPDGAAPPAQAAPANPPAPTVEPSQAPPVVEGEPEPPADTLALRLGAGGVLWYSQPFLDDQKNDIKFSFIKLILDAKFGRFGFYSHIRFRDTKLRPFMDGPVWIEEAYASADLGTKGVPVTLKAGKISSQLGLPWDNSFYGNIQMGDGLKLASEFGLSLEGRFGAEDRGGIRYAAQFFPVDGRTNYSFKDRDTLWIEGARRRNESLLRIEPFLQFTRSAALKTAVSGAYLQADLPGGAEDVFRGAVDATLTIGTWGLWGEVLLQKGQTMTDFPYAGTPAKPASLFKPAEPAIPGRFSSENYYVLAGTEYTYGPVTARYNFSYGRYADQSVSEWMHVPGIGVALNQYLTVLTEFVLWPRSTPEGDSTIDRSLNISVTGSFSALVAGKE